MKKAFWKNPFWKNLFRFLKNERGATAIEYAFLASMIAVAIVGALITIGPTLSGIFANVQASL